MSHIVDAFDELREKKLCNSLVICVSVIQFSICSEFHSNISNSCQDFADLLLGYFNFNAYSF